MAFEWKDLALMVLGCLSPCSHLELSIGRSIRRDGPESPSFDASGGTCCASLQSLVTSKVLLGQAKFWQATFSQVNETRKTPRSLMIFTIIHALYYEHVLFVFSWLFVSQFTWTFLGRSPLV